MDTEYLNIEREAAYLRGFAAGQAAQRAADAAICKARANPDAIRPGEPGWTVRQNKANEAYECELAIRVANLPQSDTDQ